jgi:hypothetical protein
MFASWIESFYGVLPSKPLSEAFDFAVKASRASMKLWRQAGTHHQTESNRKLQMPLQQVSERIDAIPAGG